MVLRDLARYREAEALLLRAEPVLRAAEAPAGRHAECVAALVALYEEWQRAEPGAGHEAKAAQWRGR